MLEGRPDAIVGFRLETLAITDPDVIATSGSDQPPVLIAADDAEAHVDGTVFELTIELLHAADAYEVDDYARVEGQLRSGGTAWGYGFAGS